jgi:uncharacterized protein
MQNIIKKLPQNTQETIAEILALFNRVDLEVDRFVGLSGIHCPACCGTCCESQKIETTALEMMPLACHLWAKNEASKALLMLSEGKDSTCIFYQKEMQISQKGHCQVYELRPLICRLFGFFTVKNKYGKYVYGSCKVIKESYPEAYKKALEVIGEGHHPSNMTDFAIRILAQGSELGKRMLPINIALKIALEKVGFILSLTENPPENPKPKAA